MSWSRRAAVVCYDSIEPSQTASISRLLACGVLAFRGANKPIAALECGIKIPISRCSNIGDIKEVCNYTASTRAKISCLQNTHTNNRKITEDAVTLQINTYMHGKLADKSVTSPVYSGQQRYCLRILKLFKQKLILPKIKYFVC